jgi:hypothetical protein
MSVLSRDQLVATGRLTEDKVELGEGYVIVRALTRGEAIRVRLTEDLAEQEPLILHLGVKEPALSLEDARAWVDAAPAGEIQAAVVAVATLSGMQLDEGPDVGKERTKSPARGRRPRR